MIRASRSAGRGLYHLSVWICSKLNLDEDKWELWIGLALFFTFIALGMGLAWLWPDGTPK